jgi:hypothetical protein
MPHSSIEIYLSKTNNKITDETRSNAFYHKIDTCKPVEVWVNDKLVYSSEEQQGIDLTEVGKEGTNQ